MSDPMMTASRAYHRFARLAAHADRARPTRLDGWSVGDLVDHVAWGAAMEADAVRTAVGARGDASVDSATPDLNRAVAAFDRAAHLGADPAVPVAVPAATVAMAYAGNLFAFEAALHASDLAHALTGTDPVLDDAELAACEVVVGPMLDLIAGTAPLSETGSDVVIDLVGLDRPIRLSAVGGAWHRGAPDQQPATTTLTGSRQDLILFVCGRADTSTLQVTGVREHAARFKAWFPGP